MAKSKRRARRTSPPVWFTCEHCEHLVTRAEGEIWRNHCPTCLWSKHVELGDQVGCPPCGGMMRPAGVGNEEVVWRCLGCGFTMRGHTDDYMLRTVGKFGYGAPATMYG